MSHSSTRVKMAAYGVSIAYSVALLLAGLKLSSTTSKVLAFVPSLIVALFGVFDYFLWRMPPLPQWLHRPDLRGTWTGTLVSMRIDESGSEMTSDPIPVFFVVRQTFTTIALTLITAESKSRSVAETISRLANEDYTVRYQYDNLPQLVYRDRSAQHLGSAALEVPGSDDLVGEYWTNRRTRGTLQLHRTTKKPARSYQDAQKLTGES